MELVALDVVGRARSFHGWAEWCAPQFEVESGTSIPAGVDGEAAVLEPPLRFEVRASALRVHVPPRALAPRRHLTAHGLWDAALGRR
jgi:hypothetical protein